MDWNAKRDYGRSEGPDSRNQSKCIIIQEQADFLLLLLMAMNLTFLKPCLTHKYFFDLHEYNEMEILASAIVRGGYSLPLVPQGRSGKIVLGTNQPKREIYPPTEDDDHIVVSINVTHLYLKSS